MTPIPYATVRQYQQCIASFFTVTDQRSVTTVTKNTPTFLEGSRYLSSCPSGNVIRFRYRSYNAIPDNILNLVLRIWPSCSDVGAFPRLAWFSKKCGCISADGSAWNYKKKFFHDLDAPLKINECIEIHNWKTRIRKLNFTSVSQVL